MCEGSNLTTLQDVFHTLEFPHNDLIIRIDQVLLVFTSIRDFHEQVGRNASRQGFPTRHPPRQPQERALIIKVRRIGETGKHPVNISHRIIDELLNRGRL